MRFKIIAWVLLLFFLIGSVSAAIRTIQAEDDEIIYTADDISYTITVVYISDGQVKFSVNDEVTDLLGYHDTYEFEDGSVVYVREILEEEAEEGPDKVVFNFYPAQCADSDCAFELVGPEEEEEAVEEEEEEEIIEEEEIEEEEEEVVEEEEEEEIIEEEEIEEEEEEVVEEEEEEEEEEELDEIDEEAIREYLEKNAGKKGLIRRLYVWFLKWFIWWNK